MAWTAALAAVAVAGHPTPLYGVETDLVGEYLPAAKELLSGTLNLAHYGYKGPGYPLLVALFSFASHGDVFLAARLLSPIAAGIAAWFTYVLARRSAGGAVATFALAAMLASPALIQFSLESGTDTPALALMLAATVLVVVERPAGLSAAAGLLAGFAVLTRGNALFLVPAGALVLSSRPKPLVPLALYAGGFAVPMALWSWVAARHGGLPADRNYLNVAWELYGRGTSWEVIESTIGSRFHSMWDVFSYAPARAAGNIASNLFVQRWRDVRELVTIAPGVLALPGLVILARDARARGWLLYGLACALILAPVFYGVRFGLYLLPIYLTGTGAALAWTVSRVASPAPDSSNPARLIRPIALATATGLILTLGWTAATGTRRELADAPNETRLAGESLAQLHLSDARIIARKPHVAWFAGMRFVPLPSDPPLSDLPAWAATQGADYLFFSGIEQVARPGYTVLADSALALPGFEQILWRRLSRDHFFAVYRLHKVSVDSMTFAHDYRAALLRYEDHARGSAEVALFVAAEFLHSNEPAEALKRLDRLERAGAHDQAVERYRAAALLGVGDLEGAASATSEAIKLMAPSAELWAQLGRIRMQQRRPAEGLACFTKAVGIEPATLEYLELMGNAQATSGEFMAAAATFERCIRLAPADPQPRQWAMTAWHLAGNDRRAAELSAQGASTAAKR